MTITRGYAAPFLAACLTALTVAVAPHAAAAPTMPSCTSMGAGATLCQTTGNAQISATVVAVPGAAR
jgi:hypothetical protein